MNEPYENKFRQTRMVLTKLRVRYTKLRVRYNELDSRYKAANAMYSDLYHQLILANQALIKAGYRRLDDMSWTDEPFYGERVTSNE
jgi:hypothetical protein